MDLPTIGLIAVSRTKENRFDPANEERYYRNMAGAKRIEKLIYLWRTHLGAGIAVVAGLSQWKTPVPTRWKPTFK